MMKISKLLICVAFLAGCAAAPTPQRIAFDGYRAQNRPLAESGVLKWSAYYTGLFSYGVAANMPLADQQRLNDLILYAQQFEAGTMSKEQFEYQRRTAKISSQADQNARADQERSRQAAAAAALSANMPKYDPSTYQIVQPVNRSSQGVTFPSVDSNATRGDGLFHWTARTGSDGDISNWLEMRVSVCRLNFYPRLHWNLSGDRASSVIYLPGYLMVKNAVVGVLLLANMVLATSVASVEN